MLDTNAFPLHQHMAAKDKAFYEQFGRRIAERRKARGITQVELAQTLGIAQQTLAHYEGGVSRIAVALLPTLAHALATSIEELVGEPAKRGGRRGPPSRLHQQIDELSRLPKAQQRFVSQMIETVLQQAAQ
jgi:transcriptional regulator with XRE-family HTH domain